MKPFALSPIIALAALSSLLAGCASGPNWQRSDIADKAVLSKQLAKDHNSCTLVSYGAAPMPSIPQTPVAQTSNVTLRGTSVNTATGERTNSVYTGQVTSAPSGGFAGGFASGFSSGAALGAAINAQRREEAIYKACMEIKGWQDAPAS